MNCLGEFYLCVPKPFEIKADNQGPKFSVVEENRGAGIISLDLGVRTFITQAVRRHTSAHAPNPQEKICNLTDECYRRFAIWLCENHHMILFPEFKTQGMVKECGSRKIYSKTAKANVDCVCSTNTVSIIGLRSSSARNTLAKHADFAESSSQIWAVQRSLIVHLANPS
ncbi:4552_t:CDS:2 [Entrophospora sp. SA101]|nr:4552_t:CDS:2 [Entrophospora sp. SA101]